MLRLVFHQSLRQTEGLLRSIANVLELDIAIPDHTTLSRRSGGLTILPKTVGREEPLHLLIDSTGLKIYGGEWLDQKRGIRSPRRWRKLHLGIDAGTHEVVAAELTPDDVGEKHGRMGWQRRSSYNRRSLVETTVYRYKTIIGRRLQARTLPRQRTEARIGCNLLNRMTWVGMPVLARIR